MWSFKNFVTLFGLVIVAGFINVHCVSNETAELLKAPDNFGKIPEGTVSSSDRGAFARCFGAIWDWLREAATSVVEDKIISGNPDNVRFYLYPDPDNKDFVQEIVYNDPSSLRQARIRPDQPWKIIVHGFTNHHISEPVQEIKNAYLNRTLITRYSQGSRDAPGYNTVVVDWGMLADPKIGGDGGNLFYKFAVINVPIAGRRVGEFVMFLLRNGGVRHLDLIHLIGFSLGSHVSGNAGNTVRELTGGEIIGRISGLDPAGPSFYQGLSHFDSRQLSEEDAKFVDIVHTNQGALGIMKNIGHANFYPNGGGPIQPACLQELGYEKGIVALNVCSHSKGPHYFAVSILREFIACRCDSLFEYKTTCPCKEKAIFGEFTDRTLRGSYYFDLKET